MSLKNTVIALGNAYENPVHIKAAPITTQPHHPSGDGHRGGVPGIGGITDPVLQIK